MLRLVLSSILLLATNSAFASEEIIQHRTCGLDIVSGAESPGEFEFSRKDLEKALEGKGYIIRQKRIIKI